MCSHLKPKFNEPSLLANYRCSRTRNVTLKLEIYDPFNNEVLQSVVPSAKGSNNGREREKCSS